MNTGFFGGGERKVQKRDWNMGSQGRTVQSDREGNIHARFPQNTHKTVFSSLSPVQKSQKRLNPHFRWGNRACVRASRKKLSLFMIEKTQLLPLSIRKHKISTSFFPYFFIFFKKSKLPIPSSFSTLSSAKISAQFFPLFSFSISSGKSVYVSVAKKIQAGNSSIQ